MLLLVTPALFWGHTHSNGHLAPQKLLAYSRPVVQRLRGSTSGDGGHEVCAVDDCGDVAGARARELHSHAGRAGDGQASGIRKLRRGISQPACQMRAVNAYDPPWHQLCCAHHVTAITVAGAHHSEHGRGAATKRMAHNLAAVARVVGQGIAQRLERLVQEPSRSGQHPKVRIPEHHTSAIHNVVRLAGARQTCEHILHANALLSSCLLR